MAEEDNFDIDIYGDLDDSKQVVDPSKTVSDTAIEHTASADADTNGPQTPDNAKPEKILDPLATTALYVADLQWWTTEDELRGWIREAGSETKLKEITFSEHKVNGKSKGVAFIEFSDPVAASNAKLAIESISVTSGASKRHQVNFTSPHSNPFRTLPKDAPKGRIEMRRETHDRPNSANFLPHAGTNFHASASRGRAGGFVGNSSRNMNMYQNTRGPPLPMQMQHIPAPTHVAQFQSTGFHPQQFGGGGYGSMPMMPTRGGMPNRMSRAHPSNGPAMMQNQQQRASLPDQFAMSQFNPTLNTPGTFPATHFNPAFFTPGGGMPSGQWDNPHGTKRQRPNE